MKRICFVLAAVASAGFAGGGEPAPAAVISVPNSFGDGTAAPADVVSWWKKFNDPELDALIERASTRNLNLRTAEARIRQARAIAGQEAALGRPSVFQTNTYKDDMGPQPTSTNSLFNSAVAGNGNTFSTGQYGLSFSESRDFFGVNRNSTKAAKSDIVVAEEDERSIMVAVLGDVATNYVQLRGLQQQLAIAQESIAVRRDYLGLLNAKLSSGLATDAQVTPLEFDLHNAETPIPNMEASIQVLAHRLAVLTGDQPDALMQELATVKPVPTGPTAVSTGLPVDLLRRRPDVRKAEQQIESARDRTKAARAERYPKFSLTGTFGAQEQGLSALKITSLGRFLSIGPSISIPLFAGGRIRADIAAETAQQDAVELNYQQVVLQSFEEVTDALARYNKEKEHKEYLEALSASAQHRLDLARQMYEAGIQDYFPVVDAQETLIATESQLADNMEIMTEDLISLYRALGGGF